ncbi:MAG: hypothetical protein BBJ57_10150 [Desulfobacterales bacterium PC51MH44]|nr:MAG: hypothetical protein BBJ57_10150 [Desulfobacterales bacterium PC51MH44]
MSRDLIHRNELLFPPYLFHPTAFETFLKDRFEHLFRNALNLEKKSLDFKVIVPSEEEARLCIQTNHTLRAKLEIRWSGSEKVANFLKSVFIAIYIAHLGTSLQFFCFEIEHRTASIDYFKTVKLKYIPDPCPQYLRN